MITRLWNFVFLSSLWCTGAYALLVENLTEDPQKLVLQWEHEIKVAALGPNTRWDLNLGEGSPWHRVQLTINETEITLFLNDTQVLQLLPGEGVQVHIKASE